MCAREKERRKEERELARCAACWLVNLYWYFEKENRWYSGALGGSEVAGGVLFFKPHSPKSLPSRDCSTATPVPRAQTPQPRARPPRTKQSHRAQRCALSAITFRRSSPIDCGLRGAGAGGAASCRGSGGGSSGAVAFASKCRLLGLLLRLLPLLLLQLLQCPTG